MLKSELGQGLFNQRQRFVPSALPVGDMHTLETEPPRVDTRVSEPLGYGHTRADGCSGLSQVADGHLVREDVVVTAQALG